jgi:hypothetical protein
MFLIVIVMAVAVASTAAAAAARTKHNCNALRATRRLPSRMTVTKTGPSPLSNRDSITVPVRKYLIRKSSMVLVVWKGWYHQREHLGKQIRLGKVLHFFTRRAKCYTFSRNEDKRSVRTGEFSLKKDGGGKLGASSAWREMVSGSKRVPSLRRSSNDGS